MKEAPLERDLSEWLLRELKRLEHHAGTLEARMDLLQPGLEGTAKEHGCVLMRIDPPVSTFIVYPTGKTLDFAVLSELFMTDQYVKMSEMAKEACSPEVR